MRIQNLLISNFRGIRKLEATDLGDTIIVAGQNGSGKSCIFDAIRLIKSTYGGYQQNEWQQFFGEFQIQLQGGSRNFEGLFNDKAHSVKIECHFELRNREKSYLLENLEDLIEQTIWRELIPEAFAWGDYTKSLYTAQFRERQTEVDQRVKDELPEALAELKKDHLVASIEITPDSKVKLSESSVISIVFSNYRPHNLGVIDFHGAQRHYGRELVQGINLNLEQQQQQYSAHTLYNYNNKYNNVKSEMAGNYIKELLAEKAKAKIEVGKSLNDTLKELFESFFPSKEFLGPQPTVDGSLKFPVRSAGSEHDLDELSSGEKEILYGYLRIRSSAPQDSIILLDEPELHLNPRLIRGLPEFYRRHLGEALENQMWLVTHSDALIREAVGKPGFNVFHMLPCGAPGAEEGQLKPLNATKDLDLVLTDLVGDLAAYRPGGKGLLFEGGGDSDFDKTFVLALFREELDGVNLLSGTNKGRVKLLHEVLHRAYEKGDLPTKFFAVVDADFDGDNAEEGPVTRFAWDVYHIENYLLEPKFLAPVVNGIVGKEVFTEKSIDETLQKAARDVVPSIVVEKVRAYGNSQMVRAIDAGFDPNAASVSEALYAAMTRSYERIQKAMSAELQLDTIVSFESAVREQIETAFADGSWRSVLPGREILKAFVAKEQLGVQYEVLRNLTIARMAELGHKPAGMKAVIDKVVAG